MPSALRVTLRPERAVLAHGHGRARFWLKLEATRASVGARHLLVALDRSSSMRGRDLESALFALRTLVDAAPEGTTVYNALGYRVGYQGSR